MRTLQEDLKHDFNKYAKNEIITADLNTYWMFIAGLASGDIESKLIDVVQRYNIKKRLEKSFFEWCPKYKFIERYNLSSYEILSYEFQLYENLRMKLLEVIQLYNND